eukprot:TRINITY_DN76954_c0_g1_i1.p2 TRINITY_DN76954_c0_g1~~TRINITY_DN76954_c0_g1_i1.p2  ORF type:complete len:130 (-),score=14.09 TRINITY_DN76954_c0_g1_i1:134-502(-)
MAEAGQQGGEGAEKAKETVTELAEGVTEDKDIGVGERPVHKHQYETKSRKPKMATMGVRQTWNDCVGMDADEAIELIKAARPDLRRVVKVPEGSMVTMDMRHDRVRVYCNDDNIVTRPPRTG